MSSSVLTTVIGRVKWIPPSSDFENTMAFGAKRFRDSSQATYTSPAGPVRTTEPCTPPQPMLQLRAMKTGVDHLRPPSSERPMAMRALAVQREIHLMLLVNDDQQTEIFPM